MNNFMGKDGFHWFFGKVVDRFDPLMLGRVRVRVYGIHPDDETLVPNDHLPWAMPIQPINSAGIFGVGHSPVGPIEGTQVFGFFADGKDCQIPFILGTVATGLGHFALNVISTASDALKAVTDATSPVQTLGQLSKSFVVKAGPIGQRLMADLSLHDYQAAAILGNVAHESGGMFCDIREGGSHGPCWPIDTKSKGYGWVQWTNSRMNDFVHFVKTNFNGYDITQNAATDDHNYSFLLYELKNTPRYTKNLKAASTIESATAAFMNDFEKPKAEYAFLDRRIGYAKQALASMNGSGPPTRATGKNLETTKNG